MQIYDFNIDSEIVRVKPSKHIGDRSYIGEKFIFKGIANGMIYLKTTDSFKIKIYNRDSIALQLDDFYDDWDYYIDPLKIVRREKIKKLDYIFRRFDISENEIDQFIKILKIGITEQEKSETIDPSLKNKLENWIKINKE